MNFPVLESTEQERLAQAPYVMSCNDWVCVDPRSEIALLIALIQYAASCRDGLPLPYASRVVLTEAMLDCAQPAFVYASLACLQVYESCGAIPRIVTLGRFRYVVPHPDGSRTPIRLPNLPGFTTEEL